MAVLSALRQRAASLAQHGNDVRLLPTEQVEFDFSTDSWGQLNQPYMQQRMDQLKSRAQASPLIPQRVFASHFPFNHFIATPLGRDAEHLLFAALAAMRDSQSALDQQSCVVVQNILFHTARSHQQANGCLPLELPAVKAFAQDSFQFKGNLDLDKLKHALTAQTVGLIFIEALSNGTGGHPISMENLRAVSTLAKTHGVALYLDATRAVENCVLIREYERAYAHCELAAILHEFYGYCDGITLSAVKDYGLTVGGLLATRNEDVHRHVQVCAVEKGLLLSDALRDVLAQAIADDDYVYQEVQQRIVNVRKLGATLLAADFPVRAPFGAHCVILDLASLSGVADCDESINRILASLYQNIGLRAARHWDGLAPEYQRPGWLRLALPLACPYLDTFIASMENSNSFNTLISV